MLNGLYNIRIRKIYLIRMHITLHRSGSVLLSYNRIHFRGKAPPPPAIYRPTCRYWLCPWSSYFSRTPPPPSLYLALAVPLVLLF